MFKKFIKYLVVLFCLIALVGCGTSEEQKPNNPDTGGNIVNPEPTPNPDPLPEKIEIKETLSFLNLSDSTGIITGKVSHLSERIVNALNNQMAKDKVLINITGNQDRTEIKDVDLPDGTINYLLKLGSGKANSEVTLSFKEDIKITKLIIKASAYYNYVEYDSSWHNDLNSSLQIKNGSEVKDFTLEATNDAKPETKVLEYSFLTPTNTFELWSGDNEKARVLIEEIQIFYAK